MSKSQRTKGAAYEREICKKLNEATGKNVRRNITQARDGGYDIPFGNFRLECKRRRTLGTIEKWLKQAVDSCRTSDQLPAVVTRSDGGESMVILSLDTFLLLVKLANV